jgi:hypothetical protein
MMSENYSLPGGCIMSEWVLAIMEPQINADECRLVVSAIKCLSNVYSEDELVISPQRMQRSAIPARLSGKPSVPRRRTRMTHIGRIFTDPRASASSVQSVFHHNPSAYFHVHPQLIFDRRTQEALAG